MDESVDAAFEREDGGRIQPVTVSEALGTRFVNLESSLDNVNYSSCSFKS